MTRALNLVFVADGELGWHQGAVDDDDFRRVHLQRLAHGDLRLFHQLFIQRVSRSADDFVTDVASGLDAHIGVHAGGFDDQHVGDHAVLLLFHQDDVAVVQTGGLLQQLDHKVAGVALALFSQHLHVALQSSVQLLVHFAARAHRTDGRHQTHLTRREAGRTTSGLGSLSSGSGSCGSSESLLIDTHLKLLEGWGVEGWGVDIHLALKDEDSYSCEYAVPASQRCM